MIIRSSRDIPLIARSLLDGNVVALPTETVMGLAISLHSDAALRKLITLKNRPIDSGKFFTLIPESKEAIEKYAVIPRSAKNVVEKYVPGAITLILPKNPGFSNQYFNQINSVGIRIPFHFLFDKILPLSGPLLLTSANPRDLPSARTPEEVKAYFGDNLDVLVDERAGGLPASTVVDYTTGEPFIKRQGPIVI